MVSDISMLMAQCAPGIDPVTMQAVVRAESGGNPYAIGVSGGRLARQPRTLDEALATAGALERAGWNYSVGLAQVNRSHFAGYGLTGAAAFDACRNLRAGADILARCYAWAARHGRLGQAALRDSLSCYASGNFQTGYRTGYVQRVVMHVAQASVPVQLLPVPAIDARAVIPVIPSTSSSGEAAAHAAWPTHSVRRGAASPDGANGTGQASAADTTATPDNSAVVF